MSTRDSILDVAGHRLHRSGVHELPAQRILAAAYADQIRPRCACTPTRPAMYLARIDGHYLVKRLPNTGHQHHPDCESWCPPEQLSGLAPMLGHAIQTGPTGTALRLGFSMSTGTSAAAAPEPAAAGPGPAESAAADGARLGLRSLLRYLWGEAGFDRWSPAMEHKRHWGVLSWYLRDAAAEMVLRGKEPLSQRLWIPEPFQVENKAAITRRRTAFWSAATSGSRRRTRLVLTLAEVKELATHRGREVLRLKHVPDLLFGLDEDLHRRIHSRFATEIELWQAHDDSHLMVLGTVQISRAGLPRFEEVALMATNDRWLPIGSQDDAELIELIADERRRFLVTGGYNTRGAPVAAAVITDTVPPTALHVSDQDQAPSDFLAGLDEAGYAHWHWNTRAAPPELPPARGTNPMEGGPPDSPDHEPATV